MALTEERLAQDLTAAMKARDAQRVAVLRGVVAAAKHLKVERRVPQLEEADLVQVIRREVRKRDEAEEYAVKARPRRSGHAEPGRARHPGELRAGAARRATSWSTQSATRSPAAAPRQLGAVMTALRERYPGRVDGKAASELARKILAEPAAG